MNNKEILLEVPLKALLNNKTLTLAEVFEFLKNLNQEEYYIDFNSLKVYKKIRSIR